MFRFTVICFELCCLTIPRKKFKTGLACVVGITLFMNNEFYFSRRYAGDDYLKIIVNEMSIRLYENEFKDFKTQKKTNLK